MTKTQKAAQSTNLWQQSAPTNGVQKSDLQPLFFNKAFIENFFDSNLIVAKEMLQSTGLLFDSIDIEFSTSNYCYIVVVNVENYRNFYSDNLKISEVRTSPTANLMQAIDKAVLLLNNYKQIEPLRTVQVFPTEKETVISAKEKIETAKTPTAKKPKETSKATANKPTTKKTAKQTTLEAAISEKEKIETKK